jgi:hypothetical protein
VPGLPEQELGRHPKGSAELTEVSSKPPTLTATAAGEI